MEASSLSFTSNNSTHVSVAPAFRRKWTLTQEAFDRLLTSLGQDTESAGKKYLEIRSNLARFFEWRGCPFPEDHADETINRVAKKLAEGEKIRNPPSYCMGIARMLFLEINKERARTQQALRELTDSKINSNQYDEFDARINCLRECLQRLSKDNRELILQYYNPDKSAKIESRKKLAEKLGVPVNTLRMRALRIRQDLERCMANCREQCALN